jgi:hypothetical protein
MNQALARFRHVLVEAAGVYDENEHPRGEGGRWAPKGSGPATIPADKRAAERDKTKTGKAVAKSIRRQQNVDWDKADVPTLKGVADKVAKAGGKTDICLVNPPLCKGTLGVERADMPQLDQSAWEKFTAAAKADGVKFEDSQVSPGELKATQGEINAVKVLGMADAMQAGKKLGGGKPIVSSDGYVLDGHHRWAASWLTNRGAKMDVVKVDLPIKKLLDYSDKFSSAKKGFYEALRRVETSLLAG